MLRLEDCGLTLRSSGPPPARHLGREPASVIIGLAAQAPCRWCPLSSNVRQQRVALAARHRRARPWAAKARLRVALAAQSSAQACSVRRSGSPRLASATPQCGAGWHTVVRATPAAQRQPSTEVRTEEEWSVQRRRVLTYGVLPNWSLERTSTGVALGPRGGRCHHPPRGPSATPVASAQLKR